VNSGEVITWLWLAESHAEAEDHSGMHAPAATVKSMETTAHPRLIWQPNDPF
jgi:hypothetical protein